jgi:NADPH-dependent 2,4-dienoyl-CoA reductase/sulfur reductase-like enzyme/ferredoxin
MTVIPIQPAAPPYFGNYTQLKSGVPRAVWWALRAAVLLATLAIVGLLFLQPSLGLTLFWGLAVPLLPALLVVAPGLWRQVCPMATLNQLPRQGGFTQGRELPAGLKTAAFAIAVAGFLGAVALRAPLLNHAGPALGLVLLAALVLAFTGGLVFKGRSGWCGTFCPLAPIQRDYGQAPLVVVKNGYCDPCLGCQKNCYDFNPRAAVFSDVYDDDPRWAGQRRLFMGLMPGLILGYFLQGPVATDGAATHAMGLLGGAAASAGVYALAVAFVPATPYRISLAFGALALAIFYAFAGPTVLDTLASLADATAPDGLRTAVSFSGVVLALGLVFTGLRAEARWREAQQQRKAAAPASAPAPAAYADDNRTQIGGGRALKDRLARGGVAEVTDRETGIAFQVAPDQTLLEAIEHAGLKISFGCRAGVCGADPVAICEGSEHLSPPGDDELATLQRLGLEGRARLACMCHVRGPVLIDRDARSAPVPISIQRKPALDKAVLAGVGRVVIVGDGVAGMSAAEALRRDSPTLRIELVANEPHAFYNRMGIGRLIYDSAAMDSLALVPPDWAAQRDVKLHRGAVAVRLDRENRRVGLASGEWLRYDRLILATGARPMPPDDGFLDRPNAFVLRSADDARQIREFVQTRGSKRAVVIGGGVLGVEAADALHKLGLKVTLLQRADRLMNAQLDAPGAAKLAGYLESIGIQVVSNVSVVKYDGQPELSAAWLSHGPRVRADLFVACLGIQANTHLAASAGLPVARGIQVDASLRTADPNIFAIGDVAELPGALGGLWPVGAAQAGTAVAAIFGDKASYQPPKIVLQLKCEGIDLRSWGEITPQPGDELRSARPEDAAWWTLIQRGGVLVGAVYVGPPGSAKAFGKLLQQPDPAAVRSFNG